MICFSRQSVHAGLLKLICLLILSVVPAGCELFGAVYESIPKYSTPAYYLKDVPTLVLLEDPDDLLYQPALKGYIASQIADAMVDQNVLSKDNLISQRKLASIAEANPDFHRWSVTRLGNAAGAQQVIRIVIVQFQLQDATGGLYRPQAQAKVKVIDAKNNTVAFAAADGAGYPVAVRLVYKTTSAGERHSVHDMANALAAKLARDIGRMFYSYEIPAVRDKADLGK